jgi:hypothetical protein
VKNLYKTPWHVRQFVKKELEDYKGNKKLLQNYTGNTRGLILINQRITQIENVVERLNKEDKEAFNIIFIDHYTQQGAEVAKGLSKTAYYYAMNKIIYLTAVEMNLL